VEAGEEIRTVGGGYTQKLHNRSTIVDCSPALSRGSMIAESCSTKDSGLYLVSYRR
jgi:hypothetical protein